MSNPGPVPHAPVFLAQGQWGCWQTPPRHLDCSQYNDCLGWVVEQRWEGFSCTTCAAYQPQSDYQRHQDLIGAADLYEAIMQGEPVRQRRRQSDDEEQP